MKKLLLSMLAVVLISSAAMAQTISNPITFEDGALPAAIRPGTANGIVIADNPKVDAVNATSKVAKYTSGGSAFINLDLNQNGQTFNTSGYDRFRVKLYVTDASSTPITNITKVRLQLDGSSDPANIIDVNPNLDGNWVTVEFTIPKKNYNMFQIRFNYERNGNPASAANDIYYFDDLYFFDSTTTVLRHTVNLNTKLYPSILKNSSELHVELQKQENVSMDLFNVNGMLIKHLYTGNPNANKFSVPVEVANKGIYLVRIKNDEGATSFSKLIIE